MAQAGKKWRLLLSVLLLSLSASGQVAFSNIAGLRAYGSPTMGNDRYTPYAIILSNSRPTFYLWDDTCDRADDGSAHVKPTIGDGYGCWEQATNAYLGAGTGLIRVGDTFSLNGYRLQWSDTATVVTINRLYSQFLTKTQSDAKYLQSFSEVDPIWVNERNFYYTKSQANSLFLTAEVDGSVTNEIQTLSYSSGTLTLSGSGSVSIPVPIFLGNVNVTQTATVALLAGVRKVTVTGVTGLLVGDRILLTPIGSTPAGYALADVVCTTNGTMEVSFTGPALVLGGSFTIPCKILVFR